MSEYWVSKKKYFCKYCDIYIADDAPSRQHHENGMRHKGNVERFIRGIYKSGEKQKKDKEEELREMKRVEQAAAAAFAQDVGAGLAKGSSGPVASTSSGAKKPPPPKPSNPYTNYTTAESLGYTDPDAERLAAELEARRTQGIVGEWETIVVAPPAHPDEEVPSETDAFGIKRAADGPPPEEDTRVFKLRRKAVNTGLGEIYDPGLIPIKVKKKEPEEPKLAPVSAVSSSTGAKSTLAVPVGSMSVKIQMKRPEGSPTHGEEAKKGDCVSGSVKWAKPQWSEPIPDLQQAERTAIFGNPEEEAEKMSEVKTEPDMKVEGGSPPTSTQQVDAPVFKKRKTPANAGRGRREV